jgi:hypothetical protein
VPIIYTVLPEELENNPAVIYALDSSFQITACNAAWDRFALENRGATLANGTQIGRNVLDVTPRPLQLFYTTLFGNVLETGDEKECVYECSSDKLFRRFHMLVARKNLAGPNPSLIIINSLVVETPHSEPDLPVDVSDMREPNGLITMCCHCRRTRLPKADNRWVWVPSLVRRMPRDASHGICEICYQLHYER